MLVRTVVEVSQDICFRPGDKIGAELWRKACISRHCTSGFQIFSERQGRKSALTYQNTRLGLQGVGSDACGAQSHRGGM